MSKLRANEIWAMLATIQFKTENIQNYNIASCFVWL
jgi:hypothetical protein